MNEKIKIIHLTSVHPSNDVRVFERELSALQEAGFDCTLVVLNQKSETASNGVKIVSVHTGIKSRLYRAIWGSIKVVLKGLSLNGKIYHIHDPELLPWTIFLRLFGKKIVYDVHENYSASILSKPYLKSKLKKQIMSRSFYLIEMFFSFFYNLIVPTTPLIAHKFRHKKTVIVENFPVSYPPPSITPKRNFNLVYAGGLTEIRSIAEMVQLTALIPEKYNSKLILAGKFNSPTYEAKVRALPEWKNVVYLGWQSRQQVTQSYLESFAGLLLFKKVPNHFYTVPNKIFEYLTSGLPVIATDFPYWKTFDKDSNCIYFVDPNNLEHVAKTIVSLFEDPSIESIRKRSTLLVQDNYTWDKEKQKLIDAYKSLAQ